MARWSSPFHSGGRGAVQGPGGVGLGRSHVGNMCLEIEGPWRYTRWAAIRPTNAHRHRSLVGSSSAAMVLFQHELSTILLSVPILFPPEPRSHGRTRKQILIDSPLQLVVEPDDDGIGQRHHIDDQRGGDSGCPVDPLAHVSAAFGSPSGRRRLGAGRQTYPVTIAHPLPHHAPLPSLARRVFQVENAANPVV